MPKAQAVNWDKKIIKTANLNAAVKDYKAFSAQVNDKVKKYGGYISQEEQSETEYKIENAVVIKIPVDQFENAVNDLLKDVDKINEKRIASDDVTAQLVDGKARLEAKRRIRLRYLDLLKQAKNMEEILTGRPCYMFRVYKFASSHVHESAVAFLRRLPSVFARIKFF